MKKMTSVLIGATVAITVTSCNSLSPVSNSPAASVEGLERQNQITTDPNVFDNAINGRNAADFSQGRRSGLGNGLVNPLIY